MAYDEQLANRIRQAFGVRHDITERKMFGGLAFLCLGRMCCGIVGSDLMVRIPDDEFDAVMRNRYVRPMDFTGKPLRGFVYVSPPASAPEPPSVSGCRAASGSPKRRPPASRRAVRRDRALRARGLTLAGHPDGNVASRCCAASIRAGPIDEA